MRTNALRVEESAMYETARVNPAPTPPAENCILTIDEVAEILRCSKTHVSNALNGKIRGTPRLTHFSIGRRKLIRRTWLEEWIEANKSSDTMGRYGQTARFGRKE